MDWYDPGDEVVVEPLADAARFWRRRFGTDVITVAPRLVYANNGMGRLFDAVCDELGRLATPVHDWRQGGYAHYRGPSGEVTVYRAPEPAPYAAADLEWLLAAGATEVLFLNGCGCLSPDLPVGSLILPDELRREEGTSFHYAPPDAVLRTDRDLQERLSLVTARFGVIASKGNHWTTDGMYRETVAKVERYRAEGYLSVDMELSALVAVARHHHRRLGALLVVTDVVRKPHSWASGDSPALERGARAAASIVANAALWPTRDDPARG
ncbi:MAG: phosphorylase family protein [Anaerolineae bacterium]